MSPELMIYLTGILTGVILMLGIATVINTYNIIKAFRSQTKHLSKAYNSYREAYESLNLEEKSDIQIKARNTMELVAEAYELPESHYESLGTTRDSHIKQLYSEYNTWVKRNGYPNFNDYLPEK